jgi:hypothetical protein
MQQMQKIQTETDRRGTGVQGEGKGKEGKGREARPGIPPQIQMMLILALASSEQQKCSTYVRTVGRRRSIMLHGHEPGREHGLLEPPARANCLGVGRWTFPVLRFLGTDGTPFGEGGSVRGR